MRQFAQKSFIDRLSVEAKVAYSTFLVFSIVGLIVSVLYYAALTNDAPFEGARQYYASEIPGDDIPGDDVVEDGEPSLDGPQIVLPGDDGPAIDLPEDGPAFDLPEEDHTESMAQPLVVPMTARKLLEVTHFHLFTIPVFLLIITHIFMLCPLSSRAKLGWIMSGTLSTGFHMAAPWIVFVYGANSAWLMTITGAWMMVSMMVLSLWPVWFMWRPQPEASSTAC